MGNQLKSALKVASASSRGLMNPPLYLIIPFSLMGRALSARSGGSSGISIILILIVSVLIIAATTNLFDDYFDFVNGIDVPGAPNTVYRKHPVFDLSIDPVYLMKYAVILMIVLAAVVLLYTLLTGLLPLILIIPLGVLISYGYTGKPFRIKYRGMGEVAVALSFIAITIIGILSSRGNLNYDDLPVLIMGGLIFPSVIFSGNLRDIQWDRKAGIRTIAVMIGKRRSIMTMWLMWILGVAAFIGLVYTLYKPVLLLFLIPVVGSAIGTFILIARENLADIEKWIGTFAFLAMVSAMACLVLA